MAILWLTTLASAITVSVSGCSSKPSSSSGGSQSVAKARKNQATLPFENMNAQVKYVGNQACVACHQEQNQSYELTAHRHALAEIDLAEEPPPGSFEHPISKRRYEIVHDQASGRLIHREKPINKDSDELSQEYVVRYVIGSGHHSRSYLIEVDDFLVESPITWYNDHKIYGMSPGYDRAAHGSFERMADVNCLMCHAGEVSAKLGNTFKPIVHQQTIGCESCHGPGEVHAKQHQGRTGLASDRTRDTTTVNPRHLSREENESVCANCHLRGVAAVTMPSKTLTSFRPGMRLQDTRVDYQLTGTDGGMKVVGHVEQMHLSECYLKSTSMTCTTCHDPQSTLPRDQRKSHYVKQCQNCHEAGCKSPEETRLAKVPDNYCVTCHMPQSPTDIPHFAFTHHRIGIHDSDISKDKEAPSNTTSVGKLVPVFESKAPASLQQRNLGLAYFELAELEKTPQVSQKYLSLSESLLTDVYNSPQRDAEVESVLARMLWEREDWLSAMHMASSALQEPGISSRARLNSLFVLGQSSLEQGDLSIARPTLQSLVKERRVLNDWLLLTLTCSRGGRLEDAAAYLQQALKINPSRREPHEMLIEIYKRLQKPDLVEHHERLLNEIPK